MRLFLYQSILTRQHAREDASGPFIVSGILRSILGVPPCRGVAVHLEQEGLSREGDSKQIALSPGVDFGFGLRWASQELLEGLHATGMMLDPLGHVEAGVPEWHGLATAKLSPPMFIPDAGHGNEDQAAPPRAPSWLDAERGNRFRLGRNWPRHIRSTARGCRGESSNRHRRGHHWGASSAHPGQGSSRKDRSLRPRC